MAQTITLQFDSVGGDHNSFNTYGISVSTGTASPNTGITYSQLTSGVSISLSSDTVSSLTCTVENGSCAGETATVSWTPSAPTPAPAAPSPTPAPAAAPSPAPAPASGLTWTEITGTDILSDLYAACADSLDQTYYATSSIVAGATQLYNTQNLADPVSDSGYIKISTSQYNVVSGKLGSAGSCPSGYSLQAFYISAEESSAGNLCNQDYLISGTAYAWLPTSGWTISELLNKTAYSDSGGTTPKTPAFLSTAYYAVSKTSGRSTQDGSSFNYITLDQDGLVGTTGESNACPAPSASPVPSPVTTAPGVVSPVDKGQEQ